MLKKIWVVLLLWCCLTVSAIAGPLTPTTALDRLFTQPFDADWFSPTFLEQIPAPQIEGLLDQIQGELGAYQAVQEIEPGNYAVQFERGTVQAQLTLNDGGQFVGLGFRPAGLGSTEAIEAVQSLPGEASLLIQQGDRVLAEYQSDRALAVGSAFKLAVLAAVQTQVEQGTLAWEQVVNLQPEWKSLPSGMLQTWPDNAPLTVQTLATLMIGLSDNTATDALMELVGQDAIHPFASQNVPLLTTQQAFKLKNPENEDLLAQYRQGDRASALEQLGDRNLPTVELFGTGVVAQDVEWFFSATELCDLMAQVQGLPLMSVNPGLANPQQWSHIAFKGGSEPGVLNFTTALQNAAGQSYCVVMIVNAEQALPENELALLYGRIIEGLHSPN